VAAKFVLEKVAGSGFRFRLMSQGRVLASSESYTTKRAAQNAIASIRTTAPSAQIDDATQSDSTKGRAVKSTTVAKKPASVVPVRGPRRRSTAKALSAPAVAEATSAAADTAAATAPAKAPAKRTTKRTAPTSTGAAATAKAPAKRTAKRTTKAAKK
jgi:DNA-binding protein HU-beta